MENKTVKDIGRRFYVRGPVEVKLLPYEEIAKLCTAPYPDHPHGCPNYASKVGCPGRLEDYFSDVFELEVKVVVLEFDFGDYLKMMKERQPGWSERQLRCPLYWQGHLRKEFMAITRNNIPWDYTNTLFTPEAYGVDVTATCKEVGIELEWPPQEHSYMVALFVKKNKVEREENYGE